MADLTASFNSLLKGHEAPSTRAFSLDTADEFLKEAYRIVRLALVIPACHHDPELTLSQFLELPRRALTW